MSFSAPEIPVKPMRRSLRERFSVVWLVPFAALLIALGVAWKSYSDRGPVMVVSFEAASGVKAGETELRYRDITVGLVEKVTFSPSLEKVEVAIRLDKDIADYVDGDASFWVVKPEVSASGVSGLDTVLSGVFIEGLWDSNPGGFVTFHEGLTTPPLLRVGEKGLQIVLRATDGTVLSEKTPIMYKGIVVGRTGKPRLVGDGSEAVVDAIIYSPHDKLVSSSTRFWDTSGFSFSIGAGGAELDFSSLATLIAGGVTFETIASGGIPIDNGVEFSVFTDETAARSSVFSDSDGPPLEIATIFSENVSGLTAGSAVELGGVRVGEVSSLRGIIDEKRFGDSHVRLLAAMKIRPERLGLGDAVTPDEALEFMKRAVAEGLRARLATASILTGGLKIELLRVEDAPGGAIEQSEGNLPTMPSTEANIKDVAATAEGVLKRVNDLPIEELMGSVIGFLNSAKTLVGNEELQRAPGEIVGLVEDARGLIGSEQIQALPESMKLLMDGLQSTTTDLQAILVALNDADAVNRLLAAVDSAGTVAGQVGTSLEGVPELIAKVDALVAKATELPLEKLLAEATDLTASAKTLFASDATQALPDNMNVLMGNLNSATADLGAIVAQVKDTDTINRLMTAIDAAGVAAEGVGTSMKGVPDLIAKIDALTAKATALPVEQLVTEATKVMASAEQLLAQDSTKALPENASKLLDGLGGATADLRVVLDQITKNDTVARLMTAIDAAGAAAAEVGTSMKGVPDLITQIDALVAKANALPVETLVAEANGVMASAKDLLASDSTKALPANLNAALSDLQKVISEVTTQDGVARLMSAIDAAGVAATKAGSSFDGVPALVEQLTAVADTANGLPLDKLIAEITSVMDNANAILATDGAKELPASLSGALEQVKEVLAELRAGGTVQNVNRTLASAADAAAAVQKATDSLPSLVNRMNTLINQATGTLANFDGNSAINRDVRSTLREMESAAKAISNLARALERRPNSVILGR